MRSVRQRSPRLAAERLAPVIGSVWLAACFIERDKLACDATSVERVRYRLFIGFLSQKDAFRRLEVGVENLTVREHTFDS